MANQEHLDILKQGVETWNKWREDKPKVVPDISGANLIGQTYSGANFSGSILMGAELSRVYLIGADLRDANLIRARLKAADLRQATLCGANLVTAIVDGSALDGADLRQCLLAEANFGGSSLRGAYLSSALLHETVFSDTDLTGAKGLDLCLHTGPSTIDHRTLAKSGKLPIEFLRGCGLPDFIIESVPALQGDPIQFFSCFISYSTKDQKFAERLYADLQNKGIRCWFAPADMKIGDPIRKTIYDQIRVYEKLLLIFSEESVESEWVRDEVEAAFEEEKRRERLMLFPIRLDEVVMETDSDWAAKIRRTRHIGDFTNWKDHDAYREAFDRLIRDLGQERTSANAAAADI